MSQKTRKKSGWTLAPVALDDAFTDFILSRQAMLCTLRTVEWYRYTLSKIISWLKDNGINTPDEITSRYIRAYLAELSGKELSDSYISIHARVLRTFTRCFCQSRIRAQSRVKIAPIWD